MAVGDGLGLGEGEGVGDGVGAGDEVFICPHCMALESNHSAKI